MHEPVSCLCAPPPPQYVEVSTVEAWVWEALPRFTTIACASAATQRGRHLSACHTVRCSLTLSLSLPAHTPLPFSHSSPSPLILFLASYISHPLLSFLLHLLHTRRPPRISSLKTGDGDETLTSRELDHKKRKKLYHRKSASSWQEVVSSSSSSFLVLYNFK